jgi:hypothetical protein
MGIGKMNLKATRTGVRTFSSGFKRQRLVRNTYPSLSEASQLNVIT